ncbi:MAG: hypothetical protein HYS53_01980 [Candidatus Aenigmarchaeota archaeon]|nr:hypothetical protein [Candidatus Aenigmarchaeota archaeon]
MSIDGASKPHLFATVVVGLFALYMIMFGSFEARITGFLILVLGLLVFAKFYEKL